MERKEIDEKLIEKGVNFLPFIGEHYEEGIGFDDDRNLRLYGKKLLVLLTLAARIVNKHN